MSAISYGGLEWQEEQLLGLLWLLERRGWSTSFHRKATEAEIVVTLVRGAEHYSGTDRSQPGQPFSSWGAVQDAVAKLPKEPATAADIDRLVCSNADLQSQVQGKQQQIEQLRREIDRLGAGHLESRRLISILVQRLGGTVMITHTELVGKEPMLVREDLATSARYSVEQDRPAGV